MIFMFQNLMATEFNLGNVKVNLSDPNLDEILKTVPVRNKFDPSSTGRDSADQVKFLNSARIPFEKFDKLYLTDPKNRLEIADFLICIAALLQASDYVNGKNAAVPESYDEYSDKHEVNIAFRLKEAPDVRFIEVSTRVGGSTTIISGGEVVDADRLLQEYKKIKVILGNG